MPVPRQPLDYRISLQRLDPGRRRWRELASWVVITTEPDMAGPLNVGLREGYRMTVTLQSPTKESAP
jgi:hypothetical protein